MIDDAFLTIKGPSQGIYREKGSKFLSFAYPVSSENEVKETLDQLKKEFHDARHHCFAYILGPEKLKFRAYDDGEPPHTAGDPILNQLRSASVTNILLVVVRYFGGTKLGKSGLIAAYKEAAGDAIKNAEIIEAFEETEFTLSFPYAATSEVLASINQLHAKIVDQKYDMECSVTFVVKKSNSEEAARLLENFLVK